MLQEIPLPIGRISHKDHLEMVEIVARINNHYHKEIIFLGQRYMDNYMCVMNKKHQPIVKREKVCYER